ncbi:MAG: hypothetical protein ABFC56_12435, partial [Clostridiaceae bacterium]
AHAKLLVNHLRGVFFVKIRTGFVSNSSSSSFLLFSDTPCHGPGDIEKMLGDCVSSSWEYEGEFPLDKGECAEFLWENSRNMDMSELLLSTYHEIFDKYYDHRRNSSREERSLDAFAEAQKKLFEMICRKKFVLYISSIEDKGKFACLENGHAFPDDTLRFSEH